MAKARRPSLQPVTDARPPATAPGRSHAPVGVLAPVCWLVSRFSTTSRAAAFGRRRRTAAGDRCAAVLAGAHEHWAPATTLAELYTGQRPRWAHRASRRRARSAQRHRCRTQRGASAGRRARPDRHRVGQSPVIDGHQRYGAQPWRFKRFQRGGTRRPRHGVHGHGGRRIRRTPEHQPTRHSALLRLRRGDGYIQLGAFAPSGPAADVTCAEAAVATARSALRRTALDQAQRPVLARLLGRPVSTSGTGQQTRHPVGIAGSGLSRSRTTAPGKRQTGRSAWRRSRTSRLSSRPPTSATSEAPRR